MKTFMLETARHKQGPFDAAAVFVVVFLWPPGAVAVLVSSFVSFQPFLRRLFVRRQVVHVATAAAAINTSTPWLVADADAVRSAAWFGQAAVVVVVVVVVAVAVVVVVVAQV